MTVSNGAVEIGRRIAMLRCVSFLLSYQVIE
jgi:hypothetical protein